MATVPRTRRRTGYETEPAIHGGGPQNPTQPGAATAATTGGAADAPPPSPLMDGVGRAADRWGNTLGTTIDTGTTPTPGGVDRYTPQRYDPMYPYRAQEYRNFERFNFDRYAPERTEYGPQYAGRDYVRGPEFQAERYQPMDRFDSAAHRYTAGGAFDRFGEGGRFSGPDALSYEGRRVGTHGMVSAARGSRSYEGRAPGTRGEVGLRTGGMLNAPVSFDRFGHDVYNAERATYDRSMRRIQPQQEREQRQLRERLAAQGIPPGSEAYNDEMARLSRRHTDQTQQAVSDAVLAGRQEHSRMTDIRQSLRRQERDEREADRAFEAGERGRTFGERMQTARFRAGEAARGYAERADQARFTAGERGRDYGERQTSEDRYFDKRLEGDRFRAEQAWRRDQFGEGQRQFNIDRFGDDARFAATHNLGADRFAHEAAMRDRHYGAGLDFQQRRYGHQAGQQDRQYQGTHQQAADRYGHEAMMADRLARDRMYQQDRQYGADLNLRGDMYGHQAGQQDWQYGAGLSQEDRHFARTTNMADRHFQAGYNQRDRFYGADHDLRRNDQRFNQEMLAQQRNIENQLLNRGLARQDVDAILSQMQTWLAMTNPANPGDPQSRTVDHTGSQRNKEGTETGYETNKKTLADYIPW